MDDMEQRRELGWLSRQVRVVVVGDREIDVHGLFEQQAAHAGEAGLLVRVCAERKRKVRVDCRVLGARMIREWRRSWISWNRCGLAAEVPGLRRDHGVAGVQPGAGRPGDAGGTPC